jgi:hypothetical protein
MRTYRKTQDPRACRSSTTQDDCWTLGPRRGGYADREEAIRVRAWKAQIHQQPDGAGNAILTLKWWQEWEWLSWHPSQCQGEWELPIEMQVLDV